MAAHGEIWWPSVGTSDGRQWGDSHGRRQFRNPQRSLPHDDRACPIWWQRDGRGKRCGLSRCPPLTSA